MLETKVHRTAAQRFSRAVQSGAVAIGVSTAGWWSLLGWDHEVTYDSDGNYSGPYEPWQVISLVVVMALLAGWLGARGSFFVGPAAAAVALPASFAVGAHGDSSGLWAVGATLLIGGTFAGLSSGAFVVHSIGKACRRRAHRAPLRR